MFRPTHSLINITRYEYKRTKAWWVRIAREGKTVSKLFSDTKYGGKRKALTAAVQFRDENFVPIDRTPGPGQLFFDRLHERWCTSIRIAPKKMARVSYAVSEYGERKAKKLAQDWLNEQRLIQKKNYEDLQLLQTP